MRDNYDKYNKRHHHDDHHDVHHEDHHKDHHEDHHYGHHDDHHRRHQQEGHDEEHERHGKHGMFIFNDKEDNLLSLLNKCGHFMHHKRGGKRGQGRILVILAEHPEICQKDLQEMLGIESGSMSEIVMKLEHKGLITRAKDDADKRMTKLMITELGLELAKEHETRGAEEDELLFGSLTKEEKEQLKALLKKMLLGWEVNYEVIRECRHHHADGEGHRHKGSRHPIR